MTVNINIARCIYCGACVGVCPTLTLTLKETRIAVDELKCIKCLACERACPANAIKVTK